MIIANKKGVLTPFNLLTLNKRVIYDTSSLTILKRGKTMALTLYVEPKKTEITEELVLNELVVDVKDKYTSVKFKNQIILKAKGKATKEEAVEYLKENKSELKKFIEKYKETNKNRIESIKKRSDKRKENRCGDYRYSYA